MSKHAYLIICHNQFDILKKTLSLLDSEHNDFFIHVDSKCKDFNEKIFYNVVHKSNLYFINRMSVTWGHYSLIDCELSLMKAAINKGSYNYLHLLSGVDLPIKSAEYIYDFFEKHKGKEFVHYVGEFVDNRSKISNRYKYYYLLNKIDTRHHKVLHIIENLSLKIQKICRVNRCKKSVFKKYGFGANWFSITEDLARFVISKEDEIYKNFKNTICCDEIFLQTIILNSDYKNRLYDLKYDDDYMACLRYVDWKRGNPYVFKNDDFEDLIKSRYLFARKFDLNVDKEIVDRIYNYICNC